MRPTLVTLTPLRALGLAHRTHGRPLPVLRPAAAGRPLARLVRLPMVLAARYSSQMPSFPIGPESESFQDQFGAQKVVIEVQAGPKTLSVWTGHVNLAIMAGARDVTLVFRGSSAEPTDAEAPVWSEGPEGADHIKQWHADLVEQLLGLVIPYLHGVSFRIVGLETLGQDGFLVGWVEQAVEQWQKQSAAEAAEAGQPASSDTAAPATTNPEFVAIDVFEGRQPASHEDSKHQHHEHSHSCGSGCSH